MHQGSGLLQEQRQADHTEEAGRASHEEQNMNLAAQVLDWIVGDAAMFDEVSNPLLNMLVRQFFISLTSFWMKGSSTLPTSFVCSYARPTRVP